MNNLPTISSLLKRSQGNIPAGPEQVLSALVEGVVNLPDREKVLLDHRVTWVWELGIHVIDDVDRTGLLKI